MKLGTKLLLAPLLTAVVVLSVGEINITLMRRAAAISQADGLQQLEQFKTLAGTQTQLGLVNAGVYRTVALMASLDEPKIKAFRTDLAQQLGGVQRTLGSALGADADAQLRSALTEALTQLGNYLKAADTAIDLASVDPNTGIAAMQQADAAFSGLSKTVGGMVARIDALSAEASSAAQADAQRSRLLLTLIGLLTAGAAVAVAWRMQRKMVAELARASTMANAVAAGDLSVRAHSDATDEVGDLLRALDRMAGQLNDTMRTVLESSQSIQTASTEIASGNLDLSQRTELTASNLQQTASSMTQLTGTVRQSADSAATANQLAGSAAQVAQRGGAVVSQVVSTMDEINTSSKKISDIIGVIDGIAFQTNILALNAAVEAARAGEQGRGFAVVASEVRSLAQRSAAAAKEIKGLIGASVDRVEAGSRLVQDAGTTMTEIVASVGKVTDIIGEIRASTVEQSEGIGTVNTAVGQLDQMTQQNAALVEQSAAAAESLRDQAGKLAGLVSGFKLQGQSVGQTGSQTASLAAARAPAHFSSGKSAPQSKPQPQPQPKPMPVITRPASQTAAAPKPQAPAPSPKAAAQADDGDWASF
ncbi:methyl-accepting chemotaxis protein [soil metagenome]